MKKLKLLTVGLAIALFGHTACTQSMDVVRQMLNEKKQQQLLTKPTHRHVIGLKDLALKAEAPASAGFWGFLSKFSSLFQRKQDKS